MTSLDNFFEVIDSILNSEKFKDCNYPIYRGHSKSTYTLLPTLQRACLNSDEEIDKLENNLYCDFRSLVGPKVSFSNSWETLFAMRHEGIPTRLLDWTENLGTAMFFALDSTVTENPHIWILNPYKLNSFSYGSDVLVNPEEDFDEEYKDSYAILCNNPSLSIHENPIVIYPKRTNERIFAQRGLFTIHGSNSKSLEEIFPECLEKIELPENLIPNLKKLLSSFGINKYSVYPDFKGLSDYLKEIYKY